MYSAILRHNIATITDPVNTEASLVVNGDSRKPAPKFVKTADIILNRDLGISLNMISV